MAKTHTLTKSKLMAWRQCERKLWLSVHRPELVEYDGAAEARFEQGDLVGQTAREIYGPGPVVDLSQGVPSAVALTQRLMHEGVRRIYEATFVHKGVLVMVDLLERVTERRPFRYRIVEVKSSTSVKDVYLEDVAVQAAVLEGSEVRLRSVHVAHIDKTFVYLGGGNYDGLLTEHAVDERAAEFKNEVPSWIRKATAVLSHAEPEVEVGPHCTTPYDCPFQGHCSSGPEVEFPVSILPYGGKLVAELRDDGYQDLRKVPKSRLSKDIHLRVWEATRRRKPFLDPDLGSKLRAINYPRYYLDFETIAFAVPRWEGTRPYQQLPFQWSIHIEKAADELEHREFLDVDGTSPMRRCMTDLIEVLGKSGPIVVYSGFEKTVLNAMGVMFPDLAPKLSAISERLLDLLPLVRDSWYHPDQKGSWSIKKVLPTLAPELSYEGLAVADGGAAQQAYLELISPAVTNSRREELRAHLLEYCGRDTLAMVTLLKALSTLTAPDAHLASRSRN